MADEISLTAAEVDGYFAADSMVRRLHGERIVLFPGARALLMQRASGPTRCAATRPPAPRRARSTAPSPPERCRALS